MSIELETPEEKAHRQAHHTGFWVFVICCVFLIWNFWDMNKDNSRFNEIMEQRYVDCDKRGGMMVVGQGNVCYSKSSILKVYARDQ